MGIKEKLDTIVKRACIEDPVLFSTLWPNAIAKDMYELMKIYVAECFGVVYRPELTYQMENGGYHLAFGLYDKVAISEELLILSGLREFYEYYETKEKTINTFMGGIRNVLQPQIYWTYNIKPEVFEYEVLPIHSVFGNAQFTLSANNVKAMIDKCIDAFANNYGPRQNSGKSTDVQM